MLRSLIFLFFFTLSTAHFASPAGFPFFKKTTAHRSDSIPPASQNLYFEIQDDVLLRDYFAYMDSLTVFLKNFLNRSDLDEHLILRANPWIVESLENTDYYRLKSQGIKSSDAGLLTIFHAGDTLMIPDSVETEELTLLRLRTWLDINLPEFRLRIIENGDTLFSFPIRIGQDTSKFLASVGRQISLRTKTGRGKIENIHRHLESYLDPETGDKFKTTRRDDGVETPMPPIPWLEPRIDGQLNGQWIHPTTRPRTLEKAYSNGCIGLREADAWRVYAHAPVGTPVFIRYDLEVKNGEGETVLLPDVYGKNEEPLTGKRDK